MSRPIRVLVVEDNEDDARLAMRMLRRGGFEPTYRCVQDPRSLQDALREQPPWDAVLSDFRLPRFSGVQALGVFRESGLDVPFIFVSGTIGEETAVEAMKAGASDYVMKQNLARLVPAMERELAQAGIRAEHRRDQQELQVSRDRYVDLYEFAPVGYLTLAAEGDIEQLNLTGSDMLGAPRDSLVGARFSRFVAPEDLERWYTHFLDVLHRGSGQRLDLPLVRADGRRFFAQLDSRLDARPGPAPPCVRLAMTDITERKEAEADMRLYEAQLRQAQKMESVGTLAGGIAHDFNNILGALMGNVEMALENAAAGHSVLPQLQEIRKAGTRARTLVRQILTFSRHEPQELITQALRPVIEETHRLLRATLPAGVELDVALSNDAPAVRADATQVQQVLMNLCTNAWHALKGSTGRIGMGLGLSILDDAARRPGLPAGRYAHVWVSDTGAGMDPATRERIFEPFFTTKPVGQGTGLGLSVAHGIVVAHHGAILVDSEPGRGSVFHLYFPEAEAPAPPGSTVAQPTAPRGHGEHVVYVDDDETMVLMVEQLLIRAGYRVSAFQSAQAAICAVRERPERFDFVVTDYNMPECSGLDVARALAGISPGLPVAISSGYITAELRALAREAGVRALLEKENTFEELCLLIAGVLAHAGRAP